MEKTVKIPGTDIAQVPIIGTVKVAGVDTAVRLHHKLGSAGAVHTALLCILPPSQQQVIVKHTHRHWVTPQGIVGIQLEPLLQKGGVVVIGHKQILRRIHGKGAQAGYVLQVAQPLLLKEAIGRSHMGSAVSGEHRENIKRHPAPGQQLHTAKHIIKGAASVRVHPVTVALPVTVQRHAHQAAVFQKQVAPFVVQQSTVGLHAELDSHAGALPFLARGEEKAKEVFPRQQRFPALKGKIYRSVPGKSQSLVHHLQGGVPGHIALVLRLPGSGQVVVKAVFTPQIAVAGSRFEHH